MGETFIGMVLQNLMALLPFIVVKSYQRGIRWKFGRNPRELDAGFHWRIWLFHQIEVIDVVDEAIELPIQTVITKDGKHVCFTVNIAYRIVDIVAHYNVEDFQVSTQALAMTHLAQRVRSKPLDELISNLDDLEKSLKGTLTTRLKDWGTQVFSVGFTNFAETRHQTRLFLDIPRQYFLSHMREH